MKKLIIVAVLMASFIHSKAQNTERDANYHLKSENFPVALDIYENLYKKDTTDKSVIYNLGICYLNCNKNPKAALNYLLKVEPDKTSDEEFYFDLGKAYLYNYKFDEAKDAFSKSAQLASKKPEFLESVNLWQQMNENAKRLTQKPLDVSFVNLGKYINSEMNESTPVITADGEYMFFTSDRKFDRAFNLYTYDVYFSELSDEAFKKGKPAPGVNGMEDEFIAGVSATGDQIFVQLQGYEAFEDLASADFDAGKISNKTLLSANVNSKSAENSATTSVSGDTIIFASARPEGLGGFDLYLSRKLPTGEWSVATNLGSTINSIYNEEFPILSADGKTLYFCSDGSNSMGGYDVFKSHLQPNGEFSAPVNLGFPLNDVFDNKTVAFSPNNRYAYVSAIRSDSYGYTDLYRVIFNQEDPSVKLYIVKLFTGTEENKTPYAAADTSLTLTAYQKGKVVFGQYAYDKKNSQATIALPPGAYTIEITGTKTETYSLKITIEDSPGVDKIVKQNVFVKPKQ